MTFSSPEAFLVHVLRAFGPYLDRLVLIGGFAARLYEHHPRAALTAMRVLQTFDADLATPAHLPVRGRSLGELAETAGLRPDFRGDRIPPVMRFVLAHSDRAKDKEEYSLEFLTPFTGAPAYRAGHVAVTTDVQAGVTAQRLRYLDLLLEGPWQVSLVGFPGARRERPPITVQVPHPGFFIVQKLLIVGERTAADRRAKDMAYIYQVASLFRRELPTLASEIRDRMEGTAGWHRWLGRARRKGEALFARPDSPGVTAAHRDLSAELVGDAVEVPTPAMIRAGVRVFLNAL